MINPVFLQIEELFSKITNGDFDNSPYSLAVELEVLSHAAWDEVDDLLTELYETDIQPSLTIE